MNNLIDQIINLPDRLKTLRENKGLTQRQLAQMLSVSPSTVASHETGIRKPTIEQMIKLSYIYDCTIDYLLNVNRGRDDDNNYICVKGLSQNKINAIKTLIE